MKKRLFRLGALCCAAAMTITTGAQALSVEEAYDILQRSYVDKLPRAAQDAKSLDELFSYTDDYTYYMTAEEYQAVLQGVEGDVSFAGIGAEITYVPEGIRIVSVLKGGGAEKAGLAAGDIIIAIESESCAPGGAEHRAKLLGEAGTSVTVTRTARRRIIPLRARSSRRRIRPSRSRAAWATSTATASARRRGRIFKRACAGMTALCARGSSTFAATAGG